MELMFYPLVILAGLACGFINTIAGSGSLITLPILIFMGLPAGVANGTNRVAILAQNLVAAKSFHQQGILDIKQGSRLLIPAMLGALVGAQIAVDLNEKMMQLAIASVMILMVVVMLLKPGKWLKDSTGNVEKPGWKQWFAFFTVGVYGGFIQAGVGIFMLASLVLVSGFDLVRGNALKVFLAMGFTPVALFVFLINDQVRWDVGLIMALGNMTGAWLGARAAIKGGAGFVRNALIVVVSLSSIKMLVDVFSGA